ncbi:hypothetical protein EJ05DRAFT_371038 [Pseudovirgaria hyperparasitica]|uniref:BZIP domain-containing protein n=1 Tax=Pseudovirgaria hyperparasitica TaxID=470096 RepID=A0A6A6W4P5_9PEZI|nr:uncharacterized protein EJ05DRAFT_371038 [Pseudovirgaria hyperparasitica]KAF2757898.1 hypothetical protein EJ05DRAFT_371038 [Pseudovirgaria hyperparasitica]
MTKAKSGEARSPAKEQLRNRESQRQSRERRKEYVLDLERRLRDYERAGSQASSAMQEAARQVVQENHGLRALLYHLGHNDAYINEFLRFNHARLNGATTESYSQLSQRKMVSETLAAMPSTPIDARAPFSAQIKQPLNNAGAITPKQHRVPVQEAEAVRGAVQIDTGTGVHADASKDTMDCEEAARLIASFRGHHSTDQIWPELGCSSAKRCAVKNSIIMSLADGEGS